MIKISTGNTKTGPSWSLPNGITCPGMTWICKMLCYTKKGRMNTSNVRNARQNNLAGTIELLKAGKFVAQMTYQLMGAGFRTMRIHDEGDFMSPVYTRAWQAIADSCKGVKFWAYTRSFTIPAIFNELLKLAERNNVAIWLSADSENWMQALTLYKSNANVLAGIAFMEDKDSQEISEMLSSQLDSSNLVIFPVHGNFGRLSHKPAAELPNCPAITRELPHDDKFPACLRCLKCLPSN